MVQCVTSVERNGKRWKQRWVIGHLMMVATITVVYWSLIAKVVTPTNHVLPIVSVPFVPLVLLATLNLLTLELANNVLRLNGLLCFPSWHA